MPDALRCFPLRIRPVGLFSDEQFYEFCRLNSDLDIERSAGGDLLIAAPASFRTSHLNLRIVAQLGGPSATGPGVATESSGGFVLPNSAVRAPDAAWIRRDRLASVPQEQQERFFPLCPDFAIELRSPSDTLDAAQAKMREYLENGLRHGWLIDPFARRVYVYRPAPPSTCWTIPMASTAPRSCRLPSRSQPRLVGSPIGAVLHETLPARGCIPSA